jgi:hypothetical protein
MGFPSPARMPRFPRNHRRSSEARSATDCIANRDVSRHAASREPRGAPASAPGCDSDPRKTGERGVRGAALGGSSTGPGVGRVRRKARRSFFASA